MKSLLTRLTILVIVSLVASACGNNRPKVVTGVQVQSQVVNEDMFLSVAADINLGNMSFPAVELPIIHPRYASPIGTVSLMTVLGGKNQLKISVNVSELTNLQAAIARLPNGGTIPLIANNPTIAVALGKGAQLYLTLSETAVAIGVAVPFSTFDGIGNSVGSANLFPVFTIDKLIGAAGIFTSAEKGKSGFAFIADVSQYVRMQDIYVPAIVPTSLALNYNEQIPASSKEKKINDGIYNLDRKKAKLSLNR
ncbi:MAG: hypothetical protein ACOVP4_02790 [Bacteriovoracaceae bacterium]